MLNKQIIKKCIFIRNNGNFYYDFTHIINDKAVLPLIAAHIHQILLEFKCDTIIGHGYGGAQLCAAIIAAYPEFNSLIVRDSPHPTQARQIEGNFNKANRVVFVDDAMFSGGTVDKLKAILTANQFSKICGIAVLYDDWRPDGTRRVEQQYRLKVKSAVRRHDIGLTRDAAMDLPIEAYDNLLIHKTNFAAAALAFADYTSANVTDWGMASVPLFHDHILINATDNYNITAYDTRTFEIAWEIRSKGGVPNRASTTKGIVQELSIAEDGYLYIAAYDGSVKKIEPLTGEVIWETKINDYIHATPIYKNDKLYLNTESWNYDTQRGGGKLFCVDAISGIPVWFHRHDDFPPSSVLVHNERIYATANDGTFTCFSIDGELIWQRVLPAEAKLPAIEYNGFLYILNIAGWLFKYSLDGERIWSVRASTQGWQVFMKVYQGLIVTYSHSNNHLHGFNPVTGGREWISKLRSPAVGLCMLGPDDMLVGSKLTHVAYYHKLDKIWELNASIPGAKLASSLAVNKDMTQIAFNMQTGGLQVYNI